MVSETFWCTKLPSFDESQMEKAVDNNKVFGTILTVLSKAFDFICHDLLIAKLHVYGVTLPALK